MKIRTPFNVAVRLIDPTEDTVVSVRAAFVMSDGSVVDPLLSDSTVVFPSVALTSYKVSVCHRNHLDIISDQILDLSDGEGAFNFVNSWAVPPIGMQPIGGSNYAMFAGDVNADHKVSYLGGGNDRGEILIFLGGAGVVELGYYRYDVNFDGKVSYLGGSNDRGALLILLGGAGNVTTGQLAP